MIEIIETRIVSDRIGQPSTRHTDIIITSGANSYLYGVGGLPLTGNLQTNLEAREAELFAEAQATGKVVDLYGVTPQRIIKSLALVIMDELNILRNAAGLAPRTANQIEAAIKTKMKIL